MAIPPIGINPNVGVVRAVINTNLTEVIQKYTDISSEYKVIQDNLLQQLNDIFNTHIQYDAQRHISFSGDFVKNICVDRRGSELSFMDSGRNRCRREYGIKRL